MRVWVCVCVLEGASVAGKQAGKQTGRTTGVFKEEVSLTGSLLDVRRSRVVERMKVKETNKGKENATAPVRLNVTLEHLLRGLMFTFLSLGHFSLPPSHCSPHTLLPPHLRSPSSSFSFVFLPFLSFSFVFSLAFPSPRLTSSLPYSYSFPLPPAGLIVTTLPSLGCPPTHPLQYAARAGNSNINLHRLHPPPLHHRRLSDLPKRTRCRPYRGRPPPRLRNLRRPLERHQSLLPWPDSTPEQEHLCTPPPRRRCLSVRYHPLFSCFQQ